MNETCGSAKKEESQFETLLRELEVAVTAAQNSSDTYAAVTCRLTELNLKCEDGPCDKPTSPMVEPNTVVFKLKSLILRLQNTNRKNSEIIDHLEILV